MLVQFATQSYQSDSKQVSAQRCVNMFAEAQPQSAKTPVAVFGVPGLVDFTVCGTGPVRGFHELAGTVYTVSGGFLYSISSTGVATVLGGQISGNGVVAMDDNGTELSIVNGVNGYIYSVDAGLRLVTDVNFKPAESVAYQDGFFLYPEKGANKVFRSDILDGTTFDGTAFARAETQSDNVIAVRSHKDILYPLGAKSTELWSNAGAANFPFRKLPGGLINRGIAGPLAITDEDEALFILGNDRIMYRLQGKSLGRRSTHAIEQAWQKYTQVSDCIAFSFTFEGHKFVYLTFPGANVTWGFDIATKLWHERVSWDEFGNSLGRWRANCAIEAYDKVLIGDAYSGKVGYLDRDVFTEFGNTVQAELISPPIHADRSRTFHSRFELDIQSGTGISTGQGSNPQVRLGVSDDGGVSFSDQELWDAMGAMGEYKQRLRWLRLGNSYERVYKLTMSDPVKRTIIEAHSDVEAGL